MTAALRDHEPRTLVGQTLRNTYRVTAELGVGAMGTVYEAEQIRLKRLVALKVLASRYRENVAALKRFHNEVRALVLLEHPHIVRIFDFAMSEDGRPFLVMEHLQGTTVGSELATGALFPVASTLEIAMQAGEALLAAHSKGIVHRDLKPDNLFLCTTPNGTPFVKVLDFGISRLPEGEGMRITEENEVVGTPEYMSPEQALGRNDLVNGRADQHALALVMYEMLSGMSPFVADDVEQTLTRVAHFVPPLVSDYAPLVPHRLALVLRRALSKNPSDRYAGIDEFMRAVSSAAHTLLVSQPSPPPSFGSDAPPGSMPRAKSLTPRDPVRTVALILSRARAASLKGDHQKATALSMTALDTAALTGDEAILALIEIASPFLEDVLRRSLEPMDRQMTPRLIARGLLSTMQLGFLSSLRSGATIADALRTSQLPRIDTLRVLNELVALGAMEFQAAVVSLPAKMAR